MRYWPTEEKEALRALVTENLTGEVIANRLSVQFNRVLTRSAVNGQINRMGLKNGRPVKQSKPKPKPKVKGPVGVPSQITIDDKIKMRPCTIFQLTENRCRYPLWPDHLRARPDYLFCGAKVNSSPYCKQHERVVYNKAHRLPSVSLTTMYVAAKPPKSKT